MATSQKSLTLVFLIERRRSWVEHFVPVNKKDTDDSRSYFQLLINALRQQLIEDMCISGMGDKAQKAQIRAIKDFADFLRRSPATALPEDLSAY